MELSPAVRAFLEERRFAVLATTRKNGTPHQVVMWYELQGDTVMMNTRRGRLQDRNLLRDPRASICIEDGARFVAITGECALLDDQEQAQADIKALALRYDGAAEAERSAAGFRRQERVTIRLRIDSLTTHGFGA